MRVSRPESATRARGGRRGRSALRGERNAERDVERQQEGGNAQPQNVPLPGFQLRQAPPRQFGLEAADVSVPCEVRRDREDREDDRAKESKPHDTDFVSMEAVGGAAAYGRGVGQDGGRRSKQSNRPQVHPLPPHPHPRSDLEPQANRDRYALSE